MKYRADIDGLRAIAVLSVLLFHAGFQKFAGGYVGVDVFFVISGYLITKLIKEQVELGTFSFGGFYLRRARRLFPAMIVTYLLTAAVAILLFAPPFLERFGGELIHAMGSISNFYFWLEADYFDAGAKMKPLLHTWSLSVEEQFYLVWPLMLVLAMKVRGKWLAPMVLLVISVASLWANDAAVGTQAVVAKDFASTGLGQILASTDLPGGKAAIYFLLPFRVFEFGFGAIVAWLERFQPKRRTVLDVLMLTGLALIGYSVFTFNDQTLFPWFNAVPPCLGTALLIYAGRDSRVGKLVGTASGIGRISYSVYLVHWPIIVFTEYWLIDPPSDMVRYVMVAVSIAAGWLLYRFVETPFRHAETKAVPGMVSAADATFGLVMFASAAVVFIIGSSIWKFDGWKWRVDERYAYSAKEFHLKFWGGAGLPNNEFFQIGKSPKKEYLFFGDSYGLQYAKALDSASANDNVGFKAFFHQGCLILPNVRTARNGIEDETCTVEYPKIKAAMDANPTQDVVFAGNWTGYRDRLMDGSGTKLLVFKTQEDYAVYLAKIVAAMIADGGDQRQYFIIGSPNQAYNAIACLGSSSFIPRNCKTRSARHDTVDNNALKALAKPGSNVHFVDPNEILCNKESCVAIMDGNPIYSDGQHLSVMGAEFVAPYLVKQLDLLSAVASAHQSTPDADRGTPRPGAADPARTGEGQRVSGLSASPAPGGTVAPLAMAAFSR